jgi:16S rRNA A1518/A1519 N6-dimethyltransferase RsmA/KsgA/DIM1 with predicted DNA glycosylase/AP lyase activity
MGTSIVWSSVKLGISPMPSSKHAREAMLNMSSTIESGPIYELGCGWGNLLIPLARQHPNQEIVAYELSLIPWMSTLILIKIMGIKNITLHRSDFLKADLSKAAVVICYLFPAGMHALEKKIDKENKNLKHVISNNFALPSHTAMQTVQINDLYKSPIYLYTFDC